jgi:hypothetical protein
MREFKRLAIDLRAARDENLVLIGQAIKRRGDRISPLAARMLSLRIATQYDDPAPR